MFHMIGGSMFIRGNGNAEVSKWNVIRDQIRWRACTDT